MKKIFFLLLFVVQLNAQSFTTTEIAAWEKQAKDVTITRDRWGIPHVEGKTDADAVFGLIYAQCEDDFQRVELNYIEKLGRLSEIEGESKLYNDLQNKLLIEESGAKSDYEAAAPWMKKLLNAHAAGLNYFLYKNKNVKPALLTRFEPWYALL
ncbi:MAG: penicillin acylase family protein, partial [Spirosomaceae bacterium]|nr:penicillin acylase family protein [Spirosomataceae bacterium]